MALVEGYQRFALEEGLCPNGVAPPAFGRPTWWSRRRVQRKKADERKKQKEQNKEAEKTA